MPDLQLVTLKCKIKPRKPDDCGYTTWERVKEAMRRQESIPILERLRPCVPKKAWLYCASCLVCKNSLWDLMIDGVEAQAVVRGIRGKIVELYLPKRDETVEYSIARREWRLLQREEDA